MLTHPPVPSRLPAGSGSSPDCELTARCLAGDAAARRELYERTADQVYRILLRMTGNGHEAADLMHDAYIKAFSSLHRFDSRSNVATWVCRIAINEALQAQRRRRTFQQKVSRLAAVPAATPCGNGAVAHRLDVESALTRLRPLHRALLVLRYQEGLDYRAIGELCGLPEGTVASRLNRARAHLRRLLQPDDERVEVERFAVHQTVEGTQG
jgi:RNA polymerase sigma-70 factor (ECF subfamily)